MLVLACSLLGRPLHEAWHIAHPAAEGGGGSVATSIVVAAMTDVAGDVSAHAGAAGDVWAEVDDAVDGIDDGDGRGVGRSDGDEGRKADLCAWCLFHAQAAATGHVPTSLLTHAEASPPPAALPDGWIASVGWTVAKPRGPPSA